MPQPGELAGAPNLMAPAHELAQPTSWLTSALPPDAACGRCLRAGLRTLPPCRPADVASVPACGRASVPASGRALPGARRDGGRGRPPRGHRRDGRARRPGRGHGGLAELPAPQRVAVRRLCVAGRRLRAAVWHLRPDPAPTRRDPAPTRRDELRQPASEETVPGGRTVDRRGQPRLDAVCRDANAITCRGRRGSGRADCPAPRRPTPHPRHLPGRGRVSHDRQ